MIQNQVHDLRPSDLVLSRCFHCGERYHLPRNCPAHKRTDLSGCFLLPASLLVHLLVLCTPSSRCTVLQLADGFRAQSLRLPQALQWLSLNKNICVALAFPSGALAFPLAPSHHDPHHSFVFPSPRLLSVLLYFALSFTPGPGLRCSCSQNTFPSPLSLFESF